MRHKSTSATFVAFLIIAYMLFSESRKKITTIHKDRNVYKLHIQPYFGNKKYKEIKVKEILSWRQYLQNELKLTASNINNIMKIFNKFYTYASKVYLINYNPISIAGRLKETRREYVTWNVDEFKKFFDALETQRDRTAFRLLYFTGMRRGEFLALQWNDYDGKSINIRKSCLYVKGGYLIGEPKTQNSYRQIELDDTTNKMLQEWKKEMEQYDGYNEDWYIFGHHRPMAINTLSKTKDKYIKIADVKHIRLHDFRHSHVSLLINNNVPLPAIAARAGDTIDMILKTYAHLFKETNKQVMETLNKF